MRTLCDDVRPPIRYLTTTDGVRLAYSVHGEGPPLVYARGWLSHLDLFWDDIDYRAFFEAIGSRLQVIRFDMRGNGLSQREVDGKLSFDELVLDLEAVFDELSLDKAVLYATCYGGPVAITYAAAHPDRVSKLVLDGTYSRGPDLATPEIRESVMSSARMLATMPAAGHAMLAYFTRPDALETRAERLKRSRQCITGPIAEALYGQSFEWDITAACAALTMPTLVTHRRRSRAVPVKHGQQLASLIPNAQFVVGEGSDHNPWEGDAAEPLRAMARFLGEPIDAAFTRRVQLRPTVILFTDMEGSTSTTVRMGDERAQGVVRAHDTIVHAGLESHAGKRVKSTGDGVMAEFASVSQALLAAAAIQRQLHAHNEQNPDASIRVRMGVNAGEPLEEDDDLHGIVVSTASRICAEARGGEVLVSNVVRELASGKNFNFTDVGVFDLKGIDEPARLFRLDLP